MYLTMALLPVNDTGPLYSVVGPELFISSCYDYQCLFMSVSLCLSSYRVQNGSKYYCNCMNSLGNVCVLICGCLQIYHYLCCVKKYRTKHTNFQTKYITLALDSRECTWYFAKSHQMNEHTLSHTISFILTAFVCASVTKKPNDSLGIQVDIWCLVQVMTPDSDIYKPTKKYIRPTKDFSFWRVKGNC